MAPYIEIGLRALLVIAAIIALTRLHGLRSFSNMSGFDFAITVSIGSVLAGAVTTLSTPLSHFVAALVGLFAVQILLSQSRARASSLQAALDNDPLMIMDGEEILRDNLAKAGMTEADLWAKLREANAFDLSEVHAVIFESTGDVSVLHGPADGPTPDARLLADVNR